MVKMSPMNLPEPIGTAPAYLKLAGNLRVALTPPRGAWPKFFALPCRSASLLDALLLVVLLAASATAQVPRGVFSLLGEGRMANDGVLANPDVLGISLRQGWADLEKNEG